MPEEADLQKNEGKDEDDEEKTAGEKMDMDFDVGNEFKDQLIPLALEYFLEVIEDDDGSDGDSDDDDEGDKKGKDGDSDDDEKPKGKKKGKKGGN